MISCSLARRRGRTVPTGIALHELEHHVGVDLREVENRNVLGLVIEDAMG
ncbi:MAG TPA: hypothetical protein VGR22_03565 [Thermomicrobiales bacterium]|nr:hypothetical protein [Thermomicrobiales bacterium]